MALRKPLVMNSSGHPEQLQAGDTLDATVAGGTVLQFTNTEAGAVTVGQAVHMSAADSISLSQANAVATSRPIGLVADSSIAAAGVGGVAIDGVLSSPDWTAVVGAAVLVATTEYFLSPDTAGSMTSTPPQPTDIGEFVVSMGTAVNTTDFRIEVHPYIKL